MLVSSLWWLGSIFNWLAGVNWAHPVSQELQSSSWIIIVMVKRCTDLVRREYWWWDVFLSLWPADADYLFFYGDRTLRNPYIVLLICSPSQSHTAFNWKWVDRHCNARWFNSKTFCYYDVCWQSIDSLIYDEVILRAFAGDTNQIRYYCGLMRLEVCVVSLWLSLSSIVIKFQSLGYQCENGPAM